jgi:hypothetical protein
MIATGVFGVFGFGLAATFPIAKAPITPMISVTPSAPR